ncbi:glucan 1,4-alpha-glucosidase [Halobaculum sp. WSA2]|uniref:Glucan 1,4-alpha-glucosidase n=1 Tax=Halobaculum saliterrae TaxID=2073113 RepID=A0A6B0SP28_9EURY|nr:glycoside hydrolase family 15 protein [Halobaculum saliterrae]MXR40678.1 glucan 1,4-alpha-glucosidase [Halobaculum saliterrae]
MRLRDALDDHKRNRDHPTRFPGERRTTAGLFSGAGGRLLHVAPDGGVRDFGYPLSGRFGLADSRFALRIDDPPADLDWDDDAVRRADDGTAVIEPGEGEQSYHASTTLVETVHETPVGGVRRFDLAVETDAGEAHVTRVAFDDAELADSLDASLLVGCTFAPEGRDARVGQLHHSRAVEVFHDRERDFLAAPDLDVIGGGLPAGPDAVLAPEPHERGADSLGDRREEDHLGGHVVASTGFADGVAAVATLLTDGVETDREAALETVDDLVEDVADVQKLRDLAVDGDAAVTVPSGVPRTNAAVDDLRVLSLLSAPTGMRIAGPDFDPHYVHSGGYGYTWFRDDAEISGFLLDADAAFDLGLEDWHRRSARAYLDTQLPDGTWPHRVWPRNGALAPGWANARMEAGENVEYQADQTASVVAFLARLLDRLPEDDPLAGEIAGAIDDGLDGLIASVADDHRPVACQNAWEDAGGRFTHTAARFLAAFSAVAALGAERFGRAVEAADRAALLYDSLDDLWVPDRGAFAVRERDDGSLDGRYDSATFALADAHRAYAAIGDVDDVRRDRLVSHVDATVDGLFHDPDASDVAGLVRYEGDGWRQRGQGHEKIWTVSTAWGANAAAEVAALLADADDARSEAFVDRSRELLDLVGPDGPLTVPGGFLPEQFFDDGTPDSATPLGWPHAIRLASTALLNDLGAFADRDEDPVPADD